MSTELVQYLSPYMNVAHLAAWGAAQNLEGLGLFKYINNQYMPEYGAFALSLDPSYGVRALSGLYNIIMLFVFVVNLRAGFHLGIKVGISLLIVWLIPGALASFGFQLDVEALGPDKFEIGEGYPGGIVCAGANLFIFLVMGWSVFILFGSFMRRDKFKNVYDHIWYPLAIVAALYFVTDAGLSSYSRDMDEQNQIVTGYLNLYMRSVENVIAACVKSDEVLREVPDLCSSSIHMLEEIRGDLKSSATVRSRITSPAWADNLSKDKLTVASIEFINRWACEENNLRSLCFKVPDELIAVSSAMDQKYMFIPPMHADRMHKIRLYMERVDRKISWIRRSFNFRYFIFMGVSFLAGGKVSNSSRSLLVRDVARPASWVCAILGWLISALRFVASLLVRGFACGCERGMAALKSK